MANRTRRRAILGAVLMFCLTGGQAQTAKDTLSLTLERAIEIALSDNPTMKVADEEIQLKKVANKEAWQSLLPEASGSFSLDHTIKASTLKLGDQSFKMGKDNTTTGNAGLSVSLPLFAPAVYRTMSITKKDIELALEQSRSSRLSLINQVTKAYFQLLLSQDTHEVMVKSYKLAEDNFNVVNAKYTQGSVSEFDKISAEVQMRSTKPSVVSAANAITLAQLQLKVLMGITEDVALVIADNLSNYEVGMFSDAIGNSDLSLDNNSTMKQLEMNRNMLQQNIKLARTNFIPTLGMSFSYQYQSLYNPDFNFFKYDWSNSSSIAFSLSIPLYKASNFTKVKSARIQLKQLEWNITDTERNLNTQAQSYRNNMKASTEQVVSNKENVAQAEKAVQIASKRYEVGRGTVLELNSSQVSLTQAQLTYNQSIYDYLTAKADLDQVLGIDVTK